MNRYLNKFRELRSGVSLRSVFTVEWATAVQDAIRALAQGENITVEGGATRTSGDGKVRIGARQRFTPKGRGAAAAACPFGSLVTVEGVRSIRGGLLVCGDQNFAVPNQVLDLETDGVWLVEISLAGVTPATDDDDEIFLSGVVTATGTPAWANSAYTGTESYTDTTNPTAPGGTGTAIIPIGVLTIADGVASLVATGCGTITIGQCAGIISHSRG